MVRDDGGEIDQISKSDLPIEGSTGRKLQAPYKLSKSRVMVHGVLIDIIVQQD